MEKKGNSRVILIEEGKLFVTKQMEATSGKALPEHKASIESVLVVTEGECILNLSGTNHPLKPGESRVIPAEVWHQIRANPDFKALHIMPQEIRFEFR